MVPSSSRIKHYQRGQKSLIRREFFSDGTSHGKQTPKVWAIWDKQKAAARIMARNLRFGSPSDPSSTASAELPEADQFDTRANCDPDRLIQCPFDKSHQIRACRFPYHLIKCGKNHPKLESELKSCPFNARHLVPKQELRSHTETCSDRTPVDNGDAEASCSYKWKLPVTTWENPNPTEDWEQEADDHGSVFVLGKKVESAAKSVPQTTVNKNAELKKPKTLPWSNF